jgi:hypothetical protein
MEELTSESESESYITTDGQSASLSWNKAPILGLRPDFYYCLTVAGLLMWGALSDDRTGLSFTIAAGNREKFQFLHQLIYTNDEFAKLSPLVSFSINLATI